jgi:hypothetical protein
VQFTADRQLYEQIQELRALMRHQIPDGDVGKILARAVAVLLAQVRKRKFAQTSTPRAQRAAESRAAARTISCVRARTSEKRTWRGSAERDSNPYEAPQM